MLIACPGEQLAKGWHGASLIMPQVAANRRKASKMTAIKNALMSAGLVNADGKVTITRNDRRTAKRKAIGKPKAKLIRKSVARNLVTAPKDARAQSKRNALKTEELKTKTITAAWRYQRGQGGMLAVIKEAVRFGQTAVAAVRDQFHRSYMASALFPTHAGNGPLASHLAKADTIRNAKGHTAKGKLEKGKARRTEDQETLYAASRKAWSRLASLVPGAQADKRGGANNKGKAGGKTSAKASKVTPNAAAVSPKLKTVEQINAHFMLAASTLLATCNKNAEKTSAAIKSAVQDFHAAITKAMPKADSAE